MLLLSVVGDAPASDRDKLAAIRERSLSAFLESTAPNNARLNNAQPSNDQRNKRSRMFTYAIRSVAVVAASAAAIVVWFNLGNVNAVSGAPLSDVLADLRTAKTLELRVVKDGHSAEVLVAAPGSVRYEDSPRNYRIAAGSRLWRIDETANTVTTGDSPWFRNPKEQVDLVSLLDVGIADDAPLLKSRPTGKARYEDRECDVYSAELAAKTGRLHVEAFTDPADNRLLGITARPIGPAAAIGPPLAELRLVAINAPVDETKFVVAKSLIDNEQIGKIRDAQGIVVVRPALAQRWTPVCREMSLRPGDWLRTDIRGANAVIARLSSDVELTLGPGTLVECISPHVARLHSGEVQVNLPKQSLAEFELLAPREGGRKFTSAGKSLVRVDRDEKVVDEPQRPKWLAGFESTSSDESIGSLVVNLPDGGSQPLAVGYHKVNVDIRDQIARTTIEESFVNHTSHRLEGVFYFPLPQDASISDFGMWIGNDLVEADVVEKQRAREIYETILREKRDPGLLEWTGGNIFKARVFPIEANSEKRIKIVYTQVLPLRGNRYRYTYGLRSELLRTTPLRELDLTVTVNSALPLKSVSCPSHSARIEQTAHSAQVAFTAQEYIPSRDFEVVCEIDGRQSDVVVIPHQRGDDGYFMVQLTPPSPEGNWRRDLVADGKPLEIVLLCDTSGSMDSEKRKQQAEFVGTLLASLGKSDRFLLAGADVGTDWASNEPMAPTAENIAKARDFLDHRLSLGWTNLQQAFEAVLKKAPAGAQVVYIGDGIVTAGAADPDAFVKWLDRLLANAKNDNKQAGCTFHAVTVGNSYDLTVLNAIASHGGGSVRSIGGDQTPQSVALEWLKEIAEPGLRDLNVEFRGVKVAALYPSRLPNLAAGMQQILVGRYLPNGADQQGEIVVTGHRGAETVRYAANIDLKNSEAGNSFIPRLWARDRLDDLLAQGQSEAVRDQIIALSEEFHIMTPYTSLLVLETDADRERFGVKRRFNMRDGERFFVEGKNNASYELSQQQMKRAGDWRIGLRRQVLANLMRLGRDARMFQPRYGGISRRLGAVFGSSLAPTNMPFSSVGDDYELLDVNGSNKGIPTTSGPMFFDQLQPPQGAFEMELSEAGPGLSEDKPSELAYTNGSMSGETTAAHDMKEGDAWSDVADSSHSFDSDLPALEMKDASVDSIWTDDDGASPGGIRKALAAEIVTADSWDLPTGQGYGPAEFGWDGRGGFGGGGFFDRGYYRVQPNYTAWVGALFSAVPPPIREAAKPSKPPESWSLDAIELAKSLLRTESLKKLDGGLELHSLTETFDPRWNRRTSRHADLTLYSTKAWLTRTLDLDAQTIVNYCDSRQRGAFSLSLLLGRERKSTDRDLSVTLLNLSDWSLSPLDEGYRRYEARVVKADAPNQTMLILKAPDSESEQRFLIDTARHVLLKIESFDGGKLTSTVTYSDFVEVAGSWWARGVTTTDSKQRKTAETTLDIKSLPAGKYAERIAAELNAKSRVLFLRLPLPKLNDARQHVADGSAGFDDRIVMMLHDARLQQWDDMLGQLDAIEKSAVDKPGVRWIRPMILQTIRRNDEARRLWLAEARKLAHDKQQDELFLAGFVLGQSVSVASPAEYLEFVEILKPVFDRQPAELNAKYSWLQSLANTYDRLGRTDEVLALKRKLAEEAPWDTGMQTDYANRLMQAGHADAAYQWLQAQLDRPIERDNSDDESLRTAYANLYRGQARWADLLQFTTAWIDRKPQYESAYQQHLSALIYNDKFDDANKLAMQWLKEAQIDSKLTPDQESRLGVAISFAQGNVYDQWYNRMDERWFEPISEAIRFFIRSKTNAQVASRLWLYQFTESDSADRLRGYFLNLLETDLASRTPEQINLLVGWSLSGRIELVEPLDGRKQLDASEIPDSIWRKIADQLHRRWKDTPDKSQQPPGKQSQDKQLLGDALRTIYATRFHDTDLLPLLRERLAAAGDNYKASYRDDLFNTLLSWKWSEAIENEAFTVWTHLADGPEQQQASRSPLVVEVPALYRLVDAMVTNRQTAAEEKLHDAGNTDKLTRSQLASKKAEFRKQAREGVAARLAAEAAKNSGPLEPWLRIEQAYLDVQLDQHLAEVETQCWKILGEAPPTENANAEPADELSPLQIQQRVFDALLRQRAIVTVMNLAARRDAKPAAIEHLIKYIDAGISLGGDSARPWRFAKFQLLIALDRPDDLERELRAWIRADVSTAPWRKALAMLVAERGKFDEAISLFEAAEKDHLLSAADYRVLANWYLVSGRREAYERSQVEAFKMLPEQSLSNMFYRIRYRWNQGVQQLPTELDENTLFAMQALFEKSAQPENYLWTLNQLYAACRDFRLLEMLPHAVVGRSPQQIYPFLESLQSQILGEIHNEATTDEIIATIKKLRGGQLTTTDLRALDLLEAIIERQASEVLNSPGPHYTACLAALRRAFERKWGDGEPRLMASFLRNLGTLRDPKLIDEQIRELRALAAMTPPTSRDHLHITDDLCNLLFSSYNRHDEAIREMEAEVRGYSEAHGGRWPFDDDDVLGSYVSLLEGAKQFATGETVLLSYLKKPQNEQQRTWLQDRLLQLYNGALDNDGEVTLGSGNELLQNIVAEATRRIDASSDENVRGNVVNALAATFDIAQRHKLEDTAELLRTFVFKQMPVILRRQHGQYQNTARAPLNDVEQTLGPTAALRYVVERMEQFPQWLDLGWNSGWQTFANDLGRLREAAEASKDQTGELDSRVLKLVIRELKRDLVTQERRNGEIYCKGYIYFWWAKQDDFAKAANEVYREYKSSGRRAVYIANYLWGGLERRQRAIEILLSSQADGLLDESGQSQLVEYLQQENRFGESIAVLEPLVKDHPDSMHHRTRLMLAYFHTHRHDQLLELVKQTAEHFHQGGRWTEGNIAEFGHGVLDCGSLDSDLLDRAVAYTQEAISLYQRNNSGSGAGDATLSGMYQQLADAYSRLGQTKQAVEAATGAIVCWGPQQGERQNAINKLHDVLAAAKDLDAYVRSLDQEAAKTGQDSPIVRKAIGQTYQSRSKFAKAITQFQLAIQLQPTDIEVHQALIACYDATGKKSAATRELLALIDLDRHNLALYQQLADRFKDNEAQAERAATSIIEAGPHEAENQAAMAELRQKENRWNEAIPHWEEAAKLRRLEPTNLIKLIEAELHTKHWDAARESIRKLQKTDWPSRFNNVESEIRRLQNQLPK